MLNSVIHMKHGAIVRPLQLMAEQCQELERAGQLYFYTSPEWTDTNNKPVSLKFDLARQGVSLIRLSWWHAFTDG